MWLRVACVLLLFELVVCLDGELESSLLPCVSHHSLVPEQEAAVSGVLSLAEEGTAVLMLASADKFGFQVKVVLWRMQFRAQSTKQWQMYAPRLPSICERFHALCARCAKGCMQRPFSRKRLPKKI